jgi:pre-rRNA-processing protein TSR3
VTSATPSVVVIRHPKERIAKCSLRFLHDRPGFRFFKAREGFQFDGTGHLLLAIDAPPLTRADAGAPLLLLDSTWRYLPQLVAAVTGTPIRRSLPRTLVTAYPRVSRTFTDPPAGLASIEALYAALRILGHDDPTLLDGYHWRDAFLASLRTAGL